MADAHVPARSRGPSSAIGGSLSLYHVLSSHVPAPGARSFFAHLRRQIASVEQGFDGHGGGTAMAPEGVHELHRQVRRLRLDLAVVERIAGDPIDPALRSVDARLRSIARALGAVRDSDVMEEMLNGLDGRASEVSADEVDAGTGPRPGPEGTTSGRPGSAPARRGDPEGPRAGHPDDRAPSLRDRGQVQLGARGRTGATPPSSQAGVAEGPRKALVPPPAPAPQGDPQLPGPPERGRIGPWAWPGLPVVLSSGSSIASGASTTSMSSSGRSPTRRRATTADRLERHAVRSRRKWARRTHRTLSKKKVRKAVARFPPAPR